MLHNIRYSQTTRSMSVFQRTKSRTGSGGTNPSGRVPTLHRAQAAIQMLSACVQGSRSSIYPVKLWFIKGQSFPDGDLYISVTPEGWSVRYPGLSWKKEERPLAQGIMSQRWNQGCCLNAFWQLTYVQKPIFTSGKSPPNYTRPQAKTD